MAILFCEGRRETGREGTGSPVGVREDEEKTGRVRSFLGGEKLGEDPEKQWEKEKIEF